MDRECMSEINRYCQKNKYKLDYVDVDMRGPSHDPEFTVMVKIDGKEYGTGTGKTKKEAKAAAAGKTWDMIAQKQDTALNAHAPDPVASPLPVDALPPFDYISMLNKYSQRTSQLVDYNNINRTGDAHAPMYSCSCTISGHVYGKGIGHSLAAAKQAAAKEAYKLLQEQESLRLKSENSSSTFNELSNSSREQSQSESWGITFKDSAASLAEKAKDMSLSEEPSNCRLFLLQALSPNFLMLNNLQLVNSISLSLLFLRFRREYKNIEPIGKGGFGNVFKATSRTDERTYAVKRVELISKNSVIAVPCLFIQMELCEQGPLEKWIENNRQNQDYHEMAQDKFLQILKGVEYIHSKDLIHRDLKPQNIFLSHEGKIKIGDFGLVTSVTYDTLTKNRGTQSYMAPEQSGDRYGKEVDIYALGLIWFEILSALVSHHEKNRPTANMPLVPRCSKGQTNWKP
uniref:Eukaryotic translation initiation factor 2 alpha kinase 2 n=1 Tax=Pavo cristatus TaxID=9049 RepID=A0A8C9FCN5_PAVCR